jgi:hypothetical protein
VTKLWTSHWENGCRESCSAYSLRGERIALEVVAGRVVLCVELPSAKISGRVTAERVSPGRVARQVVAGRRRTAECQISGIVTTERVARQESCLASHWGFHLRLLLFHFLAFKCIRLLCTLSLLLLSVAFTSDCCSFTFSLSLPTE